MFQGGCLATGIGSLPLEDPAEAVDLVLAHLPEIPFWPQLPRRGFREQMVPQYAEGFPGLVEDPARERIHVESARAVEEMAAFYEREMAGDPEAFALTPGYAAAFEPFVEAVVRHRPPTVRFTKGHVTGPVTFGFTLKDERGAAVFYDPNLADVVVRFLAMKARYQIRRFREAGVPTIIFLDEPYLAAFGTTGMNLSREDVVGSLDRVITAVQEAGGVAGVHCCGNTDWSLLFDTAVDVVNFDAYDYLDRMALYPERIQAFLERGGSLAWGLIPTSPRIRDESAASLADRFHRGLERLASQGIDAEVLRRRSLLTPACGMGGLRPDLARRVLALTREVSARLRGDEEAKAP